MKEHNIFSVLVIGDLPEEQMSKFDDNKDVEPYILYRYKDSEKLKKIQIDVYNKYLKSTKDLKSRNILIDKINSLKKMNSDEFFQMIGQYYYFDKDKNIISTNNPLGRWVTCEKNGELFSKKLLNLSGEYVSSEIKQNIDWDKIHKQQQDADKYNRTWELCVEKLEPENTNDINIIKNMENFIGYFESFKNCQQYIDYNTSFFTNAIVINGIWFDMSDCDPFNWVINYYNNYIKNLDGDKLLTIFECTY